MNKQDEKVIVILSQDEFAVLLQGLEDILTKEDEADAPFMGTYEESFWGLHAQYQYHFYNTWRSDDD